MPIIVEKDGQQSVMGDIQYNRLKGQGKLNGFSLVKSVPYKKGTGGQAQENLKVDNVPAEVTKFQAKTAAERDQDSLNKAYIALSKKGLVLEVPEDYTGNIELLTITKLAPPSPSANTGDGESATASSTKTEANSQASENNAVTGKNEHGHRAVASDKAQSSGNKKA